MASVKVSRQLKHLKQQQQKRGVLHYDLIEVVPTHQTQQIRTTMDVVARTAAVVARTAAVVVVAAVAVDIVAAAVRSVGNFDTLRMNWVGWIHDWTIHGLDHRKWWVQFLVDVFFVLPFVFPIPTGIAFVSFVRILRVL